MLTLKMHRIAFKMINVGLNNVSIFSFWLELGVDLQVSMHDSQE